jgi:hypothetical protein
MKKLPVLASTLAVISTLSLSLLSGASKAQAGNIVPTTEGEIQLSNVSCYTGSCIDTASLGYTVTSLSYDPNYKPSLLFSDDPATVNNYFGITFHDPDVGTNGITGVNWFRPVAINKDGTFPEEGDLEVGHYRFDFANTISELELAFFDVEDIGTKILSVNGNPFNLALAPGVNSNLQKVKLNNVNSFEVKLGNIGGAFPTGDGVLLHASVPEPGTTLSLGALAVASIFGLRQRKKTSSAA